MENKLQNINSFYFIGIGGVSMSSLAMILKSKGKKVAGYDMTQSETTKELEKNGIDIFYTHDEKNIINFDACVFTAAIKNDDPEMLFAKNNKLKFFSRAELLGMITAEFTHTIGVAGTHGKSTTTGMLSEIFLHFDKNSTVLGGATLPSIGASYKCGSGDYAVFEACEYKNSYHAMKPTVKVVLNCEHDHVDFFPTIGDVIDSFHTFIDTKKDNSIENISVVNLDCQNAYMASLNTSCKMYYYSIKEKSDFYAKNIVMTDGFAEFDVYRRKYFFIHVKLNVPGIHNVSNAMAAIVASSLLGVPDNTIIEGLAAFHGVSRRFEKKGTINGAVLIDDYAHHPDEIEATLNAAKLLNYTKITAIFQPHTYSRTKVLLSEFAKALSLADTVILADIFSAREQNTYNVSSKDIANLVENGLYFDSFEKIADYVRENAHEGELVITLGAGNINTLSELLLK